MNVNPLWSAPPSSAPERSCHSLFLLLTNRRWVVSVPSGSEHREKIPREGEFTLRTDPWAGLIASTGSFYLMVPTSAVPRSKRIMYARASATSGEAAERSGSSQRWETGRGAGDSGEGKSDASFHHSYRPQARVLASRSDGGPLQGRSGPFTLR